MKIKRQNSKYIIKLEGSSMRQHSLQILIGLRGYHKYRAACTPRLNEMLRTIHETINSHERFAIAARKGVTGCIAKSSVGLQPKEIPRLTWFTSGKKFSVKIDYN